MIDQKILCLDFGDARIGLATSQESLAIPYGILANDAAFFDRLSKIIEEFSIEKMVIGLPSPKSQMAQKVKEFSKKLAKFFPITTDFWNEEFSTVEAQRILKEQGKTIDESKQLVDELSASLILQSYLDCKKMEDEAK